MKIKNGIVEITTLKQNEKTMNEEPHTRIVHALNLPNLPKESEQFPISGLQKLSSLFFSFQKGLP